MPWRCLCFGSFEQITNIFFPRFTIRQPSQMHLTDARTFISRVSSIAIAPVPLAVTRDMHEAATAGETDISGSRITHTLETARANNIIII